MNPALQHRIETRINGGIRHAQSLSGGMISQVLRIVSTHGESLVAKIGDGGHDLRIEGFMLRYLRDRSQLPAPAVLHAEPDLLLMEYIDGESGWTGASLRHLGRLLAACHNVRGPGYGLQRDTLIGALHQPNAQSESWIAFFREQRLLYITGVARESRNLPPELEQRVRQIADALDTFLIEPPHPALIHGDMWRTNVIVRSARVVGIIDPALYYAHNEMELAYMTLFDGVGAEFFAAYCEVIPVDKAFFTVRRHIYNLYPLLVHLIIFGEKYIPPLDNTLARFGF